MEICKNFSHVLLSTIAEFSATQLFSAQTLKVVSFQPLVQHVTSHIAFNIIDSQISLEYFNKIDELFNNQELIWWNLCAALVFMEVSKGGFDWGRNSSS